MCENLKVIVNDKLAFLLTTTFFYKEVVDIKRVSQKYTHFQNAVGAIVHWLNHK